MKIFKFNILSLVCIEYILVHSHAMVVENDPNAFEDVPLGTSEGTETEENQEYGRLSEVDLGPSTSVQAPKVTILSSFFAGDDTKPEIHEIAIHFDALVREYFSHNLEPLVLITSNHLVNTVCGI